MPFNPTPPAAAATPTELRERAKVRMAKWRELLHVDPRAARDELEMAKNLTELADEAEAAMAKSVSLARGGE